jgi:hypothetical protein
MEVLYSPGLWKHPEYLMDFFFLKLDRLAPLRELLLLSKASTSTRDSGGCPAEREREKGHHSIGSLFGIRSSVDRCQRNARATLISPIPRIARHSQQTSHLLRLGLSLGAFASLPVVHTTRPEIRVRSQLVLGLFTQQDKVKKKKGIKQSNKRALPFST